MKLKENADNIYFLPIKDHYVITFTCDLCLRIISHSSSNL